MLESEFKKGMKEMPKSKLYSIITEHKFIPVTIESIVSIYFNGFTLSYGIGYYKGIEENSVRIDIYTHEENKIYRLIDTIKKAFNQESVMLVINEVDTVEFV